MIDALFTTFFELWTHRMVLERCNNMYDILPHDHTKSRNRKIGLQTFHIDLKFGKRLGITAT